VSARRVVPPPQLTRVLAGGRVVLGPTGPYRADAWDPVWALVRQAREWILAGSAPAERAVAVVLHAATGWDPGDVAPEYVLRRERQRAGVLPAQLSELERALADVARAAARVLVAAAEGREAQKDQR